MKKYIPKAEVVDTLNHGGTIYTNRLTGRPYDALEYQLYVCCEDHPIGLIHHMTIKSLIDKGIIYGPGTEKKYELI